MGFFDFLKQNDINEGIERYRKEKDAVLLDVRTKEEYAQGHIPESKNLPLSELARAEEIVKKKDTPLFVYCLSGGRSRQAVSELRKMGFSQVNDLGGISAYRGKVEL